MEFQDVVRKRRMVRAFDERPLAPELVERLLDNARRGPSAGYSQGTEFLVFEGPEETGAFWETSLPTTEEREHDGFPWPLLMRAPLLVVVVPGKDVYLDRYAEPDKGWTDRDEAHWPVPFWDIDAGMAGMLLLLTAVDLGLGALYFGLPPERVVDVMQRFGIPERRRPVGFIVVGHPAQDRMSSSARTRSRRPLDEVVHRGRW
jgi:nitroreductase